MKIWESERWEGLPKRAGNIRLVFSNQSCVRSNCIYLDAMKEADFYWFKDRSQFILVNRREGRDGFRYCYFWGGDDQGVAFLWEMNRFPYQLFVNNEEEFTDRYMPGLSENFMRLGKLHCSRVIKTRGIKKKFSFNDVEFKNHDISDLFARNIGNLPDYKMTGWLGTYQSTPFSDMQYVAKGKITAPGFGPLVLDGFFMLNMINLFPQ